MTRITAKNVFHNDEKSDRTCKIWLRHPVATLATLC